MKKKILIPIIIVVIAVAVSLAVGKESDNETTNVSETSDDSVDIVVEIPHVSDFTCDYYTTDGEKIENINKIFNPDDKIKVKINFTLLPEAYAEGKGKFTLKFTPDAGFNVGIVAANSSVTDVSGLTTTFATDDKNPKKCEIEMKVNVNYSNGNLKIGYAYDDEEYTEACALPINNDKTLTFTYDDSLEGYIVTKNDDTFEEIVVPDDIMGIPVKKIGDNAFYRCETLKSVTISDNVTEIGDSAFSGCTALTTIVLSDNLEYIGEGVFFNCNKLQYKWQGNAVCKYLGSAKNAYLCLIKVQQTDIQYFQINENCKLICDSAFNGCWALKYLTLPDGIVHIGKGAFTGCGALYRINIPNNIRIINDKAFISCWKLEYLTLPDGITSIGEDAFRWCEELYQITIPGSVTSIGKNAFNGCKVLTSVTFNGGQEQWLSISSKIGSVSDDGKTTIKCLDGELKFKFND